MSNLIEIEVGSLNDPFSGSLVGEGGSLMLSVPSGRSRVSAGREKNHYLPTINTFLTLPLSSRFSPLCASPSPPLPPHPSSILRPHRPFGKVFIDLVKDSPHLPNPPLKVNSPDAMAAAESQHGHRATHPRLRMYPSRRASRRRPMLTGLARHPQCS